MKWLYICLTLGWLYLCSSAQAQENKQYSQTLRGTVADKTLQRPLEGATVYIVGMENTHYAFVDSIGRFRLDNVPVGRYDVKIELLGYKTTVIPNVVVNSGKETILTIQLEEELVEIKEVSIEIKKDKAKPNNNLITNSVTNLRPEETNRFAGSRNDPSRMAANYAGVAGGGDQRNDIIVRGNSPLGVLWRLEGVDIPNPNHFTFTGNSGGAFSILNNNLLANSDFMTGAFPAEYGNKTAAVFDVRLREGNNEKRENTFQVGLNGIEFATEGPLSKKNGSSYLFSYRFFTLEMLNLFGITFGVNGIPQYQDATLKLHLPTKNMGTFSLWGIAGRSSIAINDPELGDSSSNPVERYDTRFASNLYASGLSNTHQWGSKTKGKLIFSASTAQIGLIEKEIFKYGGDRQSYKLRNNEGHYLLNYTLTHKVNARHFIKAGIIGRQQFFNNLSNYYSNDDGVYYDEINSKGKTYLMQGFVHWNVKLSERLSMNQGLYYQYFALNKKQALEPRWGATYKISEKHSLNMAAGMHSQTLPMFIYQYTFNDSIRGAYKPNQNLDLLRAIHLVAGHKWSLSKNLRFKAEAYYQYLYSVAVSEGNEDWNKIYSVLNTGADYGFYAADNSVSKGKGRNYGAELSLERFFNKDYYFLTNISLFRSEYQAIDNVWRSSAFNLGHVANVLVGREFHLDANNRKVLSLDFRINHSGGRRIIPVDVEASKAAGEERMDYDHAFERKVKDYFRADFKVSYNINRAKATHNIFVAADNVLNTKNVLSEGWNNRTQSIETYYQLGLFPYLGYRVQF